MDGPELSRQEQRMLADIERDLCADPLLDRRLRTMHRGIRPWSSPAARARRNGLALCASFLGFVCAVLFVRAAATSSPALLWAFAAVWVVTLVCLLLLVMRRWRRAAAVLAARKRT
ncbi:DUF3040 domain-containing protein [Streptomyces sp. NPDC058646]|uniref:DUF3040 domain-containing protein n=1 Tax=Streptomyces sp. NPDC058646 TaxID=3346574 RepID=UPI003650F22C